MKKFLVSVLAIAAIVGCKKTVIEQGSGKEFGYVDFSLTANTEMTVTTKAPTELSGDELASFNVTLYQDGNSLWTKEYSQVPEKWYLPAGTYDIFVENLTDDEAAPEGEKGCVRVAAMAENVLVETGKTTPIEVNCTPVNSRVTIAYDQSFLQVFEGSQVIITDGSRQFEMADGHDQENGVYYPGGTELTWKLTTTLSGESSAKTYTSGVTPIITTPGAWTQITFSTSTTDGRINISITVDEEFSDVVSEDVNINPFA